MADIVVGSAPEPRFTGWQATTDEALRAVLGRARLVLVDGRSGGGKTTFASKLAALVDATLVATDDIAWYESFFGWDDLLIDGVVGPFLAGEVVRYRPPAWETRGRSGAIEVDPARPLVVEGVGAARPSLRRMADLVVWVQSDDDEARRRGIVRDIALHERDPDEAERFWDEWQREEQPFQAQSRPWEVADLVVLGTPRAAGLDPDSVWTATP